MYAGTIAKLVPLTSQSELDRSEVIPSHNNTGYGYIAGDNNQRIYFHHHAVEGCRFHELWVGQEVEYELDPSEDQRARRVELAHQDARPNRGRVTMPPSNEVTATRDIPGTPVMGNPANDPNASQSKSAPKKTQLLSVVERLERQLETPVVPGELSEWLAALQPPVDDVRRMLPAVIADEHSSALQTVTEEDMELQRRVEQLREDDVRLIDLFGSFVQFFDRIRPALVNIEPDESKGDDLLAQLVDRGLQCVIAIRTQELALETWLLEALERDRGPVD